MTEDSISRRGFLGKTAAAGAAAFAGCSAPTSDYSEKETSSSPEHSTDIEAEDTVYEALEKGETNTELGLYLEELDSENESVYIHLGGGSTQEYREGDQVICDKTEESVGAYLEDIDFEMDEIELRLEQSC